MWLDEFNVSIIVILNYKKFNLKLYTYSFIFNFLQKEFKWKLDESDRIWITWNKFSQRSFRNNFKQIKGGGDKDEWMDLMVWWTLQAKWDEDKYKKKFE